MPLIKSQYKTPLLYNRHLATIWMGRLRPQANPAYIRERISFDRDDFLDLDWLYSASDKLVILSHGLEGSSNSHAVRKLAIDFNNQGFNVLAWNMRGCSSEPNVKLKSYCSGSSDQLSHVIKHAVALSMYEEIYLVGISVGGNITLKYLGEQAQNLNSKLKSAVAICPPCDLAGSSKAFDQLSNRIYLIDFLISLKKKVKQKSGLLTPDLDLNTILKAKTFAEFDRLYTAPVNGFLNEQDYYQKSSSINLLQNIQLPTLVLTAQDDPFLSESCFPFQYASSNPNLFLEVADEAGHVAFPWSGWLSQRAKDWILKKT